MNRTASASDFFVVGGDLGPNTPSYVKRPADDELFNLALAGEFCYVLTPRQMGKSSLMNRTARRLEKKAIHTASIDLNGIGLVQIDAWYLGLLTELTRTLRLSVDPQTWWQERASLGQVQRFINFLRDVILTEVKGQVVIFIDEIDSTRNLDFKDDFFAAIRAMYNARARETEFNRLTFILLGVASPSDLIKDRTRTPFNIGQAITLQDFSQADATVLQARLEAIYPGQGEAIFSRIYYWTNGHPYLTQKLCQAAATTAETFWTNDKIDRFVESLFLTREVSKEDNLKFVRDMIIDHPHQRQMLDIYRKVYRGKNIANDEQSPAQNQLNLSGLVKVGNGYLRVRNEVYRHVFNSNWIQENTQHDWNRILAFVAVVLAVFLGAILWYNNVRVPNLAEKAELDFHRAYTNPEERVINLATLFELRGFFGTPNYDNKAKELFFRLQTGQEQFALFDVKSDRVVIVIEGLYVTLADVDNTNHTDPLLQTMLNALEKLDETEETDILKAEISSWIQGRTLTEQNLYDSALTEYNKAIALNGENPATLYERAKVLTQLGMYQAALNDLDQIIGMVRQIPDSTPTPQLINTPTPTTSGLTPTELILTTPLPVPIGTPTPIVISQPTPFSSKFVNTGQMINAVRDLINNNSNLANYLGESPDSYSNLQNFGLVPPPFDEINMVISEITNPGNSSRESLVILNNGVGTSLKDWKLEGSSLGIFVFPDIFLFSGGSIRIHTAAGENTASDFYLNRDEPAWPLGTTITLRNANNIETAKFTIPSVDFELHLARLIPIEENGGCQGQHKIFVTVLDMNGNPLDGVIVGDTFNNVEVVSGTDGPGKTSITLWNDSMTLYVKRDQDGTLYTSEFTLSFSAQNEQIPLDWLQQASYCDSPEDCQVRLENNQLCRGHYSYNVTFQRTW